VANVDRKTLYVIIAIAAAIIAFAAGYSMLTS